MKELSRLSEANIDLAVIKQKLTCPFMKILTNKRKKDFEITTTFIYFVVQSTLILKYRIMTGKTTSLENNRMLFGTIISCLFGGLFLAIGILNTFWGNDTGYGIFIILLSFFYFPPMTTLGKQWFGFSNTLIAIGKILLAMFILWSALGVGELSNKVDLMMSAVNK